MHTLEVPENAWRLGLAIAPAPVQASYPHGLGGEHPEWGKLKDNRFWKLKNNCISIYISYCFKEMGQR